MTDDIPKGARLITLDPTLPFVLEIPWAVTRPEADRIKSLFRALGCEMLAVVTGGARITDGAQGSIYAQIHVERMRAHAKHGATSCESGPPDDPRGRRLRILLEEVGEIAKEFNDAETGAYCVDLARVRAELIQVAAVAAAWADAIPETAR
jgi:hypothetical protein